MILPRILDLYCGAGGAGAGYSQAGYEVVGVDTKHQKHYPFDFVQGEALYTLEWLLEGHPIRGTLHRSYCLSDFDAIHASPPCQGYSIMRNLPWLKDKVYPLLIDPTRVLLEHTGLPWVIENVMGAHLPAGWLCGTMFDLPFYRHRYFETNWFWMAPGHPKHTFTIRPSGSLGGRARDIVSPEPSYRKDRSPYGGHRKGLGVLGVGNLSTRQRNGSQGEGVGLGHAKGWKKAASAMGIGWMNRDELTQAIPPAYTKYIGEQLMKAIKL